MRRQKVRVLFTNWADANNFNAQSLNAREIALRLDPEKFAATLFYERAPDARLVGRPHITLRQVWRRGASFQMLGAMLRGHDILFRANLMLATFLYFRLPNAMRRCETVDWLEGWLRPQFQDLTPRQQAYFYFIQARLRHRVSISEWVAQTSWTDYQLASERVISVGVDTRFFVPPATRTNAIPRVLFVGPLIERKGAHRVVEAARRYPHISFLMVGHARDAFGAELQKRVREENLNVTIEAPMAQSKLLERMQAADILLHPSLVEGVPKVTLEAAATGLPVVMFDAYQSPSVVNGVTGYQVKTFEEMMEKLDGLLQDGAQREQMGAAAREHAKKFDWDVIAREWQSYLLELVG